jgi:mRNA-degrading endonuclease RelE of RelBE toxin-antitoxin system
MGEELIKQSEAMAVFPQSGRLVLEKKDPLTREILVGSYRIIYRVDESKKVVALANEHLAQRSRNTTALRRGDPQPTLLGHPLFYIRTRSLMLSHPED